MKATWIFLPSANSPLFVAYPSHKTWPFETLSPFETIDFKFTHVPWLVFLNFVSLYVTVSESKLVKTSALFLLYLIVISFASTYSTTPSASALISTLESEATCFSNPVPTIGDCGNNKGTAWRIILDPISARFASSCSKNGIKDAEIDAIWFGATSV